VTFDPDKLREQLFGGEDSEEKVEKTPAKEDIWSLPDSAKPEETPETKPDEEQEDISEIKDISDHVPLSFSDVPDGSEQVSSETKNDDDIGAMPEPKPEYSPERLQESPQKPVEPPQPVKENIPAPDLASERTSEPLVKPEQTPAPVRDSVPPVEKKEPARIEQPVRSEPPPTEIPEPEPSVVSNAEPTMIIKPGNMTRASKPGMDDEVPDELEETTAGDFAPLREALITSTPEPEPEPEEEDTETEDYEPLEDMVQAREDGLDLVPGKKRQVSPDEIKPPSPITLLILVGGGFSIIAATIGLAMGRTDISVMGLGGIGIVLIGIFALINRLWLKLAMSARSTRYGANVATVILTFLGILIFGNILSYRHHIRYDVSEHSLNSLSPQTISVLEDINRQGEDITVMAFIPPSTDYRSGVEGLMDLYIYHSPHIKFSFVDPEIQRSLTEEKGITTSMAMLFEFGANRSVQTDFDEPHITSGLIGVRQSTIKKVMFVTGHGEVDPFNTDDIGGLSEFKDRLELEGYEIEKLTISPSAGIPDETSLVVVVDPKRPYRTAEITAMEEYLESGGSLMCFVEPDDESGLYPVFERYGITMDEGVILDDFENYNSEVKTPKIFVKEHDHPITRILTDVLIFNIAGSLRDTSGAYDDVIGEVLLTSGASAWIEDSGDLSFTEQVERRGQKYVAILGTRILERGDEPVTEPEMEPEPEPVADDPSESIDLVDIFEEIRLEPADETDSLDEVGEVEEPAEIEPEIDLLADSPDIAQVMVISDASMVLNGSSDISHNFDFALNSVNHMTEMENLIGIRPARDTNRTLDMSSMQTNIIFGVSVILTPLLIALLGGYVWWQRRS